MSWQAVAKPVMTEVYSEVIDENLIYYGLSSVSLGGNFRLVKCNLAVSPPTCSSLDTGVAVPSTDGHFNIRELLLEGNFLYGCYARWSSLNCFRFDKNTGAGVSIGSVAPTGDTSINYHTGVKIKEDTYYYMARTGTGTEWKLWRFKGSPSQITDPALWEFIDYIFRDPTSPGTCPEGSTNFSYCTNMFWVYERYLIFACYQRCPSGNVGNFAVYIFDVIKERLMNSNFEEVSFSRPTTDPAVKITVTNPLDTTGRTGLTPCFSVDTANRKFYIGQEWMRSDGTKVGVGITKVDMVTRQATYVNIPGNWEWIGVYPIGLTPDNKVVFTIRDTDNVPRVKLLDPATDSITNVLDLTGGDSIVPFGPPALNTEDTQVPIRTILHTTTRLILPPNWQDGLKVPKRIVVSSPAPNQLRVQAQFQLAPSNIRVRLWKIPDLTIAREETLPGATSIDRLYTGLAGGRYRAEVTAL
jgi:hypothetical protein